MTPQKIDIVNAKMLVILVGIAVSLFFALMRLFIVFI